MFLYLKLHLVKFSKVSLTAMGKTGKVALKKSYLHNSNVVPAGIMFSSIHTHRCSNASDRD